MDILRHIQLDDDYRLLVWDTGRTNRHGKSRLGYRLYFATTEAQESIFEGEDFCASPLHAIDSDETVRTLLGFLTLRPGDTDAEYFENYTPRQHRFAREDAERLSMLSLDPRDFGEDFEAEPLIDVNEGS